MIEGLFAPTHLLVLGGIALLLFGPSRLPELGRGFGQAIRAFKGGLEEIGAPRLPPPPEFPEAPVDSAPHANRDEQAPRSPVSQDARSSTSS